MNISYQRGIRHNYLVIDPEELAWEGYESRMLSGNTIEGLLHFQVRQQEDGTQLLYEITSRQPLSRILEGRSIRAGEIRSLVCGILRVLERMEGYLLKENHIFLEPGYLYVDPESFQVWLCLVPGLERNFADDFGKFLEYLLEHVDHEDKESVVLAYGLYQETRKENYGTGDIIRFLGRNQEAERKVTEPEWEDRDRKRVVESPAAEARGIGNRGLERRAAERRSIGGRTAKSRSEGGGSAERWGGECRAAVSRGAGNRGEEGSRKNGPLESFCLWFRERFFRSREPEDPVQVPWEMLFREEGEDSGSLKESCAPVWNFREPAGTVERRDAGSGPAWGSPARDGLAWSGSAGGGQEPEVQGQVLGTALLADLSAQAGTRRLRSLDSGNQDIDIAYFPFIIGKQQNLVDYRLGQDTVSRLHVRIDREADGYRIQDLNSTNGTYLNGQLLENNGEADLHMGDEVRIANYRYLFE